MDIVNFLETHKLKIKDVIIVDHNGQQMLLSEYMRHMRKVKDDKEILKERPAKKRSVS